MLKRFSRPRDLKNDMEIGPAGNFNHEKIQGISEIQTQITTGVRVQYGTIGGIYYSLGCLVSKLLMNQIPSHF